MEGTIETVGFERTHVSKVVVVELVLVVVVEVAVVVEVEVVVVVEAGLQQQPDEQ